MTTETISVPEVHCDHCVHAIEGALKPLDGVDAARVDLAVRGVEVTYDDAVIGRAAIVDAIEEQGYEVAAAPPDAPVAPVRGELPQA